MRKQVIKFFALDYKVFIFGRVVSWTRSANIIFPLMLLSGGLTIDENPLQFIAYSLLAIALFFGFVYFRINPLRDTDYDYFDDVQRFIWDSYHNKPVTEARCFSLKWAFWVNPITILLFLCFYFLNI